MLLNIIPINVTSYQIVLYFSWKTAPPILGSDILLAETKTDKIGHFQLEGGTSALFSMDVHLEVNHSCNEKPVS